MSASIPKPTGGVQLTPSSALRTLMATGAFQAHTTAGEISSALLNCSVLGISVEQSPSGRPKVEKKGNVLGVSVQFIAGESISSSGEAASERRCSFSRSAASPSELTLGVSTRRASTRWLRNGAASLRSTMVAAQSSKGGTPSKREVGLPS
eukprot:scaffold185_cov64-Phaeocystis_antarctica.AAC.2